MSAPINRRRQQKIEGETIRRPVQIQKIRNWYNYVVNDEESTAKQPTHQFNCFFWERMYIWKLAVMISLFRGYGQIFVGTLLAQLTKYNKERGEIKEELL